MNLLIDTSTLIAGLTHRGQWTSTGTDIWGDLPIETGFLGRIGDRPTRLDETFRSSERQFLPAIAELAKEEAINLFVTTCIEHEYLKGNWASGFAYGGFDVFHGVPIASLVEIRFWSSSWTIKVPAKFLGRIKKFVVLSREERALHTNRFNQLVHHIGRAHRRDCYNLLITEIATLDGMITMDRKLLNAISNQATKLNLQVFVEPPSKICSIFQRSPMDLDDYAQQQAPWPRFLRKQVTK